MTIPYAKARYRRCVVLIAGCAAQIDSISADQVTIIEDAGANAAGRALIKAPRGVRTVRRVPALVRLGTIQIPFDMDLERVFACAVPPAIEHSLASFGDKWLAKAQR